MEGSVSLGRAERKQLLGWYRRSRDPAVRLRAHILLLLAAGHSWSLIADMLFCSTRTMSRWKSRFEAGGIEAIVTETRGRKVIFGMALVRTAVRWLSQCSPRDFGFLRSRWSCGLVVVLMAELYYVQVSRETVRRWLRESDLVWRRPRPVIGPEDPHRAVKMRKLRQMLAHLPDNEIAVFQDEVDINLNPKIGSMWMVRGAQAEVITPGDNEKRYLAGSLNWRTGDVILTEGLPREGRNTKLFLRHLDDLRHRLRRYRVIHVICDNASFHNSRAVRHYLAEHAGRIVLHYLPTRSPDANPIERVWWHLHEEITRNHRCGSMEELLNLVLNWLEARKPLAIEGHLYPRRHAA